MRRLLLFTGLVVAVLLLPANVLASENISVTPQIERIDLSSGAAQANFVYKNSTSQTIELSLSIKNFKELGENGTPGFLDSGEDYKYGLASWATLSTDDVIIPPNEEKTLQVFIDKTRLTQGGHYAAVMAELKQTGTGSKNVQLKAVLASLLFVRSGAEYNREEGKISTFATDKILGFPDKFILRFQNTGNVDVTPHGLIKVFDPTGNLVANAIINENSYISLPETIRVFNIVIKKTDTGKVLLPGFYRADINLHYGAKNKTINASFTFFSLGSASGGIILVIALFFAAAFLIIKAKRTGRKLDAGVKT